MPQDTCGLQEIIWSVKPDLIIETGIAHGGSIIFSASMLALLDYAEDGVNKAQMLDPKSPRNAKCWASTSISARTTAKLHRSASDRFPVST